MDVTRTEAGLYGSQAYDPIEQVWWLTIVHHPDVDCVGRRVAVVSEAPLSLGREQRHFGKEGLMDSKLSRRHATATCDADGVVTVRDRDSRSGTFVNGVRIQEQEVGSGDVVGIGSILMLVHRAPSGFEPPHHPRIVGRSFGLSRVLDAVTLVAEDAAPVLIVGEPGTGKELVAREIHRLSRRRGELQRVNCGEVSDDLLLSKLFGHADGGTVFLDEIGQASPELQVELLRFLQEGEGRRAGADRARRVTTRVITATHRDLPARVAAGDFREDLYARLAGRVIDVLPLRDRKEDIPHLIDAFSSGREVKHRLMRRLLAYSWPRNVRQLETVIRHAQLQAEKTDALGLTPEVDAMLVEPGRPADDAEGAETTSVWTR